MSKILFKNITIQNPFENAFVSDVLYENGEIKEISKDIINNDCEIFEGKDKILTVGLVDRHTHGGYGCNFNTCNEEELQNYLINAQNHGITSVLPTIMTDSIEQINKQINLIKNIKSKGAKISGIHLEGPFINPARKGIHPENCILKPTIENLNKFDTEFIKVLTYAPELDENNEFLKELLKRNIIPSIGHSDCTYDLAKETFKSGAKQITHIFNAIKPIHHREPSVITAALNDDNIAIEIISDLEHIHKAVIETVLKLKPKNKILLISDALSISYSSQRETVFGGEKIFYDGFKATSQDGVLAGSVLYFDDIYKKISDFIEFKDFIGFASKNISESINIPFQKIEKGSKTDLVIWNKNFDVEQTINS
ncbi:MAG: N-acetylglucosamine-6-phosphate deacetylase [Candidatus Gastranaerophilales bacterium]|nr:N-acetylglucosamine-6-phosphate deacetylase [Candidatus Gastranaerophilales bacterium]